MERFGSENHENQFQQNEGENITSADWLLIEKQSLNCDFYNDAICIQSSNDDMLQIRNIDPFFFLQFHTPENVNKRTLIRELIRERFRER